MALKTRHVGAVKGHPKLSEVLKEMRHVSKNKAEKDESPLRKQCRTILEENPEKFIVLLGKLERDQKAARIIQPAGEGSESVDVGEDTIRELIGRILQEAKGKDVA